jgi:hypothetical protein
MTVVFILFCAFVGAAWRRWLGSERPQFAKDRDAQLPWRLLGGFPWRVGIQVPLGIIGLFVIGIFTGEGLLRMIVETAVAMGFMTAAIKISRMPFLYVAEWLVVHGLPTTANYKDPYKPMLQGPAPWAEVLQGFVVFGLVALV